MALDFLLCALGLLGLYFGAEWLVKGSAQMALKLGISTLVIGLTVVAFGTSSPELLVAIQANMRGDGSLAMGNVIGSNICNIAFILGISALIRPISIQSQLVRREVPILVVVSFILIYLMSDGRISTVEGAIFVGGILLYLATGFWSGAGEEDGGGDGDSEFDGKAPVWKSIALAVAGGLVLLVGARLLVDSASSIAIKLGVSKAIIGLTIVALGTSLPELATSIVASLKKEGDIITGGVVGSCVFNILAILGITAAIQPIVFEGIKTIDLVFMVGLAVVLLPILWTRRSLSRFEGGFLLAVYLVYCFFLWQRFQSGEMIPAV